MIMQRSNKQDQFNVREAYVNYGPNEPALTSVISFRAARREFIAIPRSVKPVGEGPAGSRCPR